MVNMIGFHHVEPRFNTAGFGEDGWFMRLHPMPTTEYPQRCRLMTPCAHARWNTPKEAKDWLHHPGDIARMAEHYIAWTAQVREGTTWAP